MGEAQEISDQDIVRALKALADPTRFRMVQEIAAAGELSCGQLTERFDVPVNQYTLLKEGAGRRV